MPRYSAESSASAAFAPVPHTTNGHQESSRQNGSGQTGGRGSGLPRTGILLTNVGSPEAPTARAVRPYLAEFLGDPRVIELPGALWKPVLHGIILNTRPRRSARLYARIWSDEGAPLIATLRRQAAGLQALLGAGDDAPLVEIGLRYGRPSIAEGLRRLREAGCTRVLVFPLYPQYSATTTATSLDAVFAELARWRWIPELRTVNSYHLHPLYIEALARSVEESWAEQGRAERLLLSFHGIPRRYSDSGDPYRSQCLETAAALAHRLGVQPGDYTLAFQSRYGPVEWLQPYTDETVEMWGKQGVRSVQALCPGFSADCLETADEIGHEAAEAFREAGGETFTYIPALNDRPDHLRALAAIVAEHMWREVPAPAFATA